MGGYRGFSTASEADKAAFKDAYLISVKRNSGEYVDENIIRNHLSSWNDSRFNRVAGQLREDGILHGRKEYGRVRLDISDSPFQKSDNSHNSVSCVASRKSQIPQSEVRKTSGEKRVGVFGLIRKMSDSGSDNEKIAGSLNQLGVPTVTGVGRWHRKTVWRILNGEMNDQMPRT